MQEKKPEEVARKVIFDDLVLGRTPTLIVSFSISDDQFLEISSFYYLISFAAFRAIKDGGETPKVLPKLRRRIVSNAVFNQEFAECLVRKYQ